MTSTNPPVRFCFDTSAWIAFLNSEEAHDLDSIKAWMKKFDSGQARMLIPSIVVSELFAGPATEKAEIVEKFMLRPEVEALDITPPIAKIGGVLRRSVINDGMKLKTPDALIIAAADYHKADYIISVDSHICRMDGRFGLTSKIGLPITSHELPLF